MANREFLLSELLTNTSTPPVMEARRWIDEGKLNPALSLMNLSQAAPIEAPPQELIDDIKNSLNSINLHTYGPVLGLNELRTEVSKKWTATYDAEIHPNEVAITSGCNQAFCTAISIIAKPGDKIILPVPWYFNHKMWLDIKGIEVLPLPCTENLEPDINQLQELVDQDTKALVLVTPNNPTGKEYSEEVLMKCAQFVKENNLFLIVDETYKDFRSKKGAPHNLFKISDWRDWYIHLYSFSKSYRLTGHRVGLMISSSRYLAHAEKFLDTVSICPNPIGQKAALFGLQKLDKFLSDERDKILERQVTLLENFVDIKNWQIISSGAYFAYLRYEASINAQKVVEKMLLEASTLILPGTMFGPKEDLNLQKTFRVAFANIENSEIIEFCNRLRQIDWK